MGKVAETVLGRFGALQVEMVRCEWMEKNRVLSEQGRKL